MTVLGAGLCPAGSSAAGFGVPTVATSPINVPFPDAQTGRTQGGYQVGLTSGDYSFTSDGRVVGVANVKSLVQHAITTTFGSSAVPNFGLQLPGGDKTSGYKQRIESRLRNALAGLVAQNLIQIVSVSVADMPNNSAGTIGTLTWRDLTAPAPWTPGTGAPSNQYTTAF